MPLSPEISRRHLQTQVILQKDLADESEAGEPGHWTPYRNQQNSGAGWRKWGKRESVGLEPVLGGWGLKQGPGPSVGGSLEAEWKVQGQRSTLRLRVKQLVCEHLNDENHGDNPLPQPYSSPEGCRDAFPLGGTEGCRRQSTGILERSRGEVSC